MGEGCKRVCKNRKNKVRIIGQIEIRCNSPIYGTVEKLGFIQEKVIFYGENNVKWPVESGGSGK